MLLKHLLITKTSTALLNKMEMLFLIAIGLLQVLIICSDLSLIIFMIKKYKVKKN